MRKELTALISLLTFLFVFPLMLIVSAEGNSISSIDIQVKLNGDGSATIREQRVMEVSEGTEVYIELSNLGPTELMDFSVVGFEEETDWDIDDSFEQKAFKYGVYDGDYGEELVWGISEYGTQEYDLTYTLSNMVRELDDGQALFWNFDSFLSLPTEEMTLEVFADFDLSEDLQELYGFGFEGPLDLVDGRLQWSGTYLDDSNDISLLLQFAPNTFRTDAQVEMTLAEQREMALEGSSYNEEGPMPLWAKVILGGFAVAGVSAAGIGVAYGVRRERIRKENNHFNPYQLMAQNRKQTDKTPPQIEGDLTNYAALLSKLSPGGAGFPDFFFAYLLLWAEQGKIQIEPHEEVGFFGRPKSTATIQIANFAEEYAINSLAFDEYVQLFELGESRFDEVIWGMLLEAADAEGTVEGEDIEKWSEKHANSIDRVVESLEEVSENWLVENGYLRMFTIDDWGFPIEIEELTPKGDKLALEIVHYQNFIKKIKDVPLTDDEDWESLMMWSVIFGQADETIGYLEDFEPETWAYLETMYPYYYGNYHGYHYLYLRNSSGLAAGGSTSAGGGFSSGGGGAGAGGGGGGGTR